MNVQSYWKKSKRGLVFGEVFVCGGQNGNRFGEKTKTFQTDTVELQPEKEEEIFIHSTTLSTITLRNFCGETFYIDAISRKKSFAYYLIHNFIHACSCCFHNWFAVR